jgi:uncharacterized membrane protein
MMGLLQGARKDMEWALEPGAARSAVARLLAAFSAIGLVVAVLALARFGVM